MPLIAQLSDPHLVAPGKLLMRSVDTGAMLERALLQAARLQPRPDLVVISGDLVNRGRMDEYARLRDLLAPLPCPWQLMPGNHDDRANLRAAFPNQGFGNGDLCCVRRIVAGHLLLFLDTLIPGEEGGEIGDRHLRWLDDANDADLPALLFLHHPPFPTGMPPLDAIGCRGAEHLASWLRAQPNVHAIACGHVHRTIFSRFADRPAWTAPSVAHQIAFDLTGRPQDLAWCREPPGFLVHDLKTDHVITHLIPIGDFPATRYG